MGRYMINDGADRFTVRDDRDTVVASGLSLVAAMELVHEGCRFCDTGQNHTNDAVRSRRGDPRAERRRPHGSLRRSTRQRTSYLRSPR
jgi:hypothetical protein